MSPQEQKAHDLGAEHARNAASWIDTNMDEETARSLLDALENGDPRADEYLPRQPNLSGEWADDLTPVRLATEILGDDVDPDALIDGLCEAYEDGVSETFETECERILRALSTHEL